MIQVCDASLKGRRPISVMKSNLPNDTTEERRGLASLSFRFRETVYEFLIKGKLNVILDEEGGYNTLSIAKWNFWKDRGKCNKTTTHL